MSEEGAKKLQDAGMNELAGLVRKIDTLPQNEGIRSAGRAFEDKASDFFTQFQVPAINDQLKKDPKLADKITSLLAKDPAGFEKAVPGIFNNPDDTSKLIDGALKTANAKTGVDPLVVAAAATGVKADPAKPAADKKAPQEPEYESRVYPKGKPVAPTAATPAVAGETLAAKMARLQKVDGYDQLMARVAKNPDLGKMMGGMISAAGSDAEKGKTLDEILARTKQDPQMLNKLVKTIDERPGLVSTLAARYAGDPKTGMERLGMYSQGGMPELMANMMDGNWSTVLEQVRNFVGGMFGGTAHFMVGASNNGMDQFMKAMEATGAKPASVVAVDANGQTSDVTAQVEQKRQAKSADAPAPAANTPNAQIQNPIPAPSA